jgi:hypothetical protein
MKNLLRLIRTIMLTRVAIQPQVFPTTLPSWLEDFNGLVGIGISNPGEDYCKAFRVPVAPDRFTRAAFK